MANRDLTAGVTAETVKSGASIIYPVFASKLEFGSGDVRLWEGIGEITLDSEVYTGASDLVGISEIVETDRVEAAGIKATLSGIPSALIATALTENYQERPARIVLAFLEADGTVIADPLTVFAGRMDVMAIREGGETSTIELAIESYLIDGDRPRLRQWTPEDQKLDFPADTGFRRVASLQDTQVLWGG